MIINLVRLGFTEADAQVYVFLATEGPQKSKDLADSLKISRRTVYHILTKLRSNGVVEASSDYPARFSAVMLEKVLDQLVKNKIKQQQSLEECKDNLLLTWQKIMKNSKK